ncbi:hypothetical protein B566_EDAN005541 [Ephemera danica]|nr:hypothetical protein B566_EDAN005541 [Ephemera danica]
MIAKFVGDVGASQLLHNRATAAAISAPQITMHRQPHSSGTMTRRTRLDSDVEPRTRVDALQVTRVQNDEVSMAPPTVSFVLEADEPSCAAGK